tara:strand:- start:33545 stop:34072 length:528 start_codon:yes stop_codon:yes gene_type:complete
MAVKITDTATPLLNDLKVGLSEVAIMAMFEGSKKIQERAAQQAPVDLGNLERAIKIDTKTANQGHIEVYIDDDTHAAGRKGFVTVGKYAERMHEAVYDLGPDSKAKQSGNGLVVGRKFLERAVADLTPEIIASVEKHVQKAASSNRGGLLGILNVLGSVRRRFTGGGIFNPRKHK